MISLILKKIKKENPINLANLTNHFYASILYAISAGKFIITLNNLNVYYDSPLPIDFESLAFLSMILIQNSYFVSKIYREIKKPNT